jgi:hypothetical protein
MTRLLHISDIHLRCKKDDMFIKALRSLRDITQTVDRRRLIIVVTGDILDDTRKSIDPDTTRLLLDFFDLIEMAAHRCIVIPGNHDLMSESLCPFLSRREFSGCSKWPGIVYYPHTGRFTVDDAGLMFHVVRASPTSKDMPQHLAFESVDPEDGYGHVALYHGSPPPVLPQGYCLGLYGDEHEVKFFAAGQTENVVGLGLAQAGVAQRWWPGAWAYAGSMTQRSLNEACYDHGALLWDLDTQEVTFYPIFSGYAQMKITGLEGNHRVCLAHHRRETWIDWTVLEPLLRDARLDVVVQEGVNQEAVLLQLRARGVNHVSVRDQTTSSYLGRQHTTKWGNTGFGDQGVQALRLRDGLDEWIRSLQAMFVGSEKGDIDLALRWMREPRGLLLLRPDDTNLKNVLEGYKMCTSGPGDASPCVVSIVGIKIQHILGIHEFERDLDETIILLLGDNASGKSSVLDCVCIALFGCLPKKRQSPNQATNAERYATFLRTDSQKGSIRLSVHTGTQDGEEQQTHVITRSWERKAGTIKETLAVHPKPYGVHWSQIRARDDWMKTMFGTVEDFVASNMLTQFGDGSLFQKRDDEAKEFLSGVAFLQPLERLIQIVHRARHLSKLNLRETVTNREAQARAYPFLCNDCGDADDAHAARKLEDEIVEMQHRKCRLLEMNPFASDDPEVPPSDRRDQRIYEEQWGCRWKRLERDCIALRSKVEATVPIGGHLTTHPACVDMDKIELLCPTVNEQWDRYRRLQDLVPPRPGTDVLPNPPKTVAETLCRLTEDDDTTKRILKIYGTEDALAERYHALPETPLWEEAECMRLLGRKDCLVSGEAVASAKQAVEVAQQAVDATKHSIEQAWSQMKYSYYRDSELVRKVVESLRTYSDQTVLAALVATEEARTSDTRQASIMQEWMTRYDTKSCECLSCRDMQKFNRVASSTDATALDDLRKVVKYHEDTKIWYELEGLYHAHGGQAVVLTRMQTEYGTKEEQHRTGAILREERDRAARFLADHTTRNAAVDVVQDYQEWVRIGKRREYCNRKREEYVALSELQQTCANFTALLATASQQARMGYERRKRALDEELRHLHTRRAPDHRILLDMANVRLEYQTLVAEEAQRNMECATLETMHDGLTSHHHQVLQHVATRLCDLVSGFCQPVGLGLRVSSTIAGSKAAFRWQVVSRGGGSNDWTGASGFEKSMLDFAARVAICFLSNARCRYKQLFLDESFTAADKRNQAHLPALLRSIARSKQFSTIMVVSHMQSLTDSFDANGVDDEVVVGRIELSKLPSGAMYRGARKRVAPTPPLPKRCKT